MCHGKPAEKEPPWSLNIRHNKGKDWYYKDMEPGQERQPPLPREYWSLPVRRCRRCGDPEHGDWVLCKRPCYWCGNVHIRRSAAQGDEWLYCPRRKNWLRKYGGGNLMQRARNVPIQPSQPAPGPSASASREFEIFAPGPTGSATRELEFHAPDRPGLAMQGFSDWHSSGKGKATETESTELRKIKERLEVVEASLAEEKASRAEEKTRFEKIEQELRQTQASVRELKAFVEGMAMGRQMVSRTEQSSVLGDGHAIAKETQDTRSEDNTGNEKPAYGIRSKRARSLMTEDLDEVSAKYKKQRIGDEDDMED